MTNKELLDSYFTIHYNYILKSASNVCSKRRDQRYNLLHEVYITMEKQLDKHTEYLKSEDDFKRYINKYLKTFYAFRQNATFNKRKDTTLFTYFPSHDVDPNAHKNEYLDEIADFKSEELIYIGAENTDDLTKLFLQDLAMNDISTDVGIKVNKVRRIAFEIFDQYEYDLFDCYFLQEMKITKIHELYQKENRFIKDQAERVPTYAELLQFKKDIHKKLTEALC